MPTNDNIEYATGTDVGLKRSHNEDVITVCTDSAMAILADGMGGYNAGEVASEMGVSVIKKMVGDKLNGFLSYLMPHQPEDLTQIVHAAIKEANSAILKAALDEPRYFGMGTTLVMTICYGDLLLVAHVGDSRAYRLRQGKLTQITRDHSVVQEQIDAGMMTAESAQHSDIKNLVTRAVGVGYPVEEEINLFQIEEGDVYLLCSDGLSDMVSEHDMQSALCKETSLQEKCTELIDLANAEGGSDNISVILFRVNNIKNTGLRQLF